MADAKGHQRLLFVIHVITLKRSLSYREGIPSGRHLMLSQLFPEACSAGQLQLCTSLCWRHVTDDGEPG